MTNVSAFNPQRLYVVKARMSLFAIDRSLNKAIEEAITIIAQASLHYARTNAQTIKECKFSQDQKVMIVPSESGVVVVQNFLNKSVDKEIDYNYLNRPFDLDDLDEGTLLTIPDDPVESLSKNRVELYLNQIQLSPVVPEMEEMVEEAKDVLVEAMATYASTNKIFKETVTLSYEENGDLTAITIPKGHDGKDCEIITSEDGKVALYSHAAKKNIIDWVNILAETREVDLVPDKDGIIVKQHYFFWKTKEKKSERRIDFTTIVHGTLSFKETPEYERMLEEIKLDKDFWGHKWTNEDSKAGLIEKMAQEIICQAAVHYSYTKKQLLNKPITIGEFKISSGFLGHIAGPTLIRLRINLVGTKDGVQMIKTCYCDCHGEEIIKTGTVDFTKLESAYIASRGVKKKVQPKAENPKVPLTSENLKIERNDDV